MIDSENFTIEYQDQLKQVTWYGTSFFDGDPFNSFLKEDVSSRLFDKEGKEDFESFLHGLASTGFAEDNLNEILNAVINEEREWAIGESIAEAYLKEKHGIFWPWNMERDKRNPKASLPGADLVGFEINSTEIRLVLGEVKTSSEDNAPPGAMKGRGGMIHQIDELANNLGKIHKLLEWLYHRCKGTNYENYYKIAVTKFLDSGNKAISLFGILIRDTKPNHKDLKNRGKDLSVKLNDPTSCLLIAIYLPCSISDLYNRISGGQ
ncbi:MAG: hypothetical protein GXY48_06735 [Methanomicrobiales archaeon]|nr:hypothetical protein [Methanomicrobiales archaeon]